MLTTEFSSLEKNIWSTRFSVKYNIDQLNNCVEMERKNFEFPKLFPNFQNFKFVLTITVIILYKPNMAEYPTTFVAEVDFSIPGDNIDHKFNFQDANNNSVVLSPSNIFGQCLARVLMHL